MPRRKRERVGWGHVAVSALGLLATNLLLRLGLRRQRPDEPPPRPPQMDPDEFDEPRVVDHTPVPPEPRDIRVGPALLLVGGILAFLGLVTVLVTGLQWAQTGRLPSLLPPAGGVDDPPVGTPPPAPRVDDLPEDTLGSVRATEAALLDYGWADEGAGIARLPVERAMELVAERGLPVAEGAEERRYADVVPVWPSDASSGREGEKLWP